MHKINLKVLIVDLAKQAITTQINVILPNLTRYLKTNNIFKEND